MNRLAIVTGANRGLGLETARQLAQQEIQVILTSRDTAKGEAAAEKLKEAGLPVSFHGLDVTSEQSVLSLAELVEEKFGWLDILVNNAGIAIDGRRTGDPDASSATDTPSEVLRETMETNTFGAFQMCRRFVPLMRRGSYGRIVNVSSGMGQLTDMRSGWPAYRISKAALNAVTRIFADETRGANILVNSACPGWVRTDMGGAGAPRSLEEGADTIVWLATLPDGGPTGGFFRDRKPIPW